MYEKASDNPTEAPATPWDTLADPRHDIDFHANYAKDSLADFCHREEELKKNHQEMSDRELLRWEEDFAGGRSRLRQAEQKAPGFSLSDRLATEADIYRGVRPEETIDAKLGRFFYRRSIALDDAIRAAHPDATLDTNPDLHATTDFYNAAMDHVVNYRYADIYGLSGMEYEDYLRGRTHSHDRVIKSLNRLNRLAEHYGTPRFTPSDFQTSDLFSVKDRNAESQANFDRDIVENYYQTAFSTDIAKIDRENRYRY